MFTVLPFTINCCKSINHWKGYYVINSIKNPRTGELNLSIPGHTSQISLHVSSRSLHQGDIFCYHSSLHTLIFLLVIISTYQFFSLPSHHQSLPHPDFRFASPSSGSSINIFPSETLSIIFSSHTLQWASQQGIWQAERRKQTQGKKKNTVDSSLRWAEVSLALFKACMRERRKGKTDSRLTLSPKETQHLLKHVWTITLTNMFPQSLEV